MAYLFYIRSDAATVDLSGGQLSKRFEPYAFTYEKKNAKLFTAQRCMKVFRMKKSHEVPNVFKDEMRMLGIPLTDHDENSIELIGSVQEEQTLQYAFDTTADFIYKLQAKLEDYLKDGFINDYGYNDMMDFLWIDPFEEQDTIPIARIDTYHLFYDIFSRTFIEPDAWEQLAPEPIPKIRYMSEYTPPLFK